MPSQSKCSEGWTNGYQKGPNEVISGFREGRGTYGSEVTCGEEVVMQNRSQHSSS